MSKPYTHLSIATVEDSAAKFGFSETQETRFANDDLETEQTGFSHHRIKPGRRQAFGHRHDDVEELYFVVSGAGRVKLDDDVVDLVEGDAIRVSAGVTRSFEGGDPGLEFIACSPRRADDRGEVIPGWWSD